MPGGGKRGSVSGERFTVTYTLAGPEEDARSLARDICFEQTVEFPEDLLPPGIFGESIVGRIESFQDTGAGRFRTGISYAAETAAGELVQLLNVVFGNISLKPGIRVEEIFLPPGMVRTFRGPRFGREGLRDVCSIHHRPLICTALKPMGLSASELAEQAYRFALGGLDMIKDDHGLTDQLYAPFEERVGRCVEAVEKANRETGKSCIYLPNITAPADQVFTRAEKARGMGARGLLICPGLTGIDVMRTVADDDSIALPLVAHPAFTGSFVTSPVNGMSHFFLYGQLMRLAGADATVFPNYSGRFSFSRKECSDIARGCETGMGDLKKIFPAPGGGMTMDRARDMLEVYGKEFVLLIGGGLHRRSGNLTENSRFFVDMLESL